MTEKQTSPCVLDHHRKKGVCMSRARYREGRDLKAVKVYTVAQESKYLLIQGVPAVGTEQELVEKLASYGPIAEYKILHGYPAEKFTETYLIKYAKIESARRAKRKFDDTNFYGGSLHICYAPEYESVDDTREKLGQRRKSVARRIRELEAESSKVTPDISEGAQKNDQQRTDNDPDSSKTLAGTESSESVSWDMKITNNDSKPNVSVEFDLPHYALAPPPNFHLALPPGFVAPPTEPLHQYHLHNVSTNPTIHTDSQPASNYLRFHGHHYNTTSTTYDGTPSCSNPHLASVARPGPSQTNVCYPSQLPDSQDTPKVRNDNHGQGNGMSSKLSAENSKENPLLQITSPVIRPHSVKTVGTASRFVPRQVNKCKVDFIRTELPKKSANVKGAKKAEIQVNETLKRNALRLNDREAGPKREGEEPEAEPISPKAKRQKLFGGKSVDKTINAIREQVKQFSVKAIPVQVMKKSRHKDSSNKDE